MYLSTVLDDYSRYIIAWKLCSTMRAEDVTDALELALAASGCDNVHIKHKPRLLSDNGPCYMFGPRIWWIGSDVKRNGSLSHALQIASYGVRPLRVLSLRPKL